MEDCDKIQEQLILVHGHIRPLKRVSFVCVEKVIERSRMGLLGRVGQPAEN
jgi:hypothetical protein